ncbi:uroporphyrin-III C-methyltransferase, partial [Bacillus xiapuensis]|nr:uroporphyrin-III C-methyltransferase [Bacillus xiapuensis]
GVGNLNRICTKLIEHGKNPSTPAAIIQSGTTTKQKTISGNLENIEEIASKAGVTHPAIVLVGEVVGVREKIKWFQEREEKTEVNIGRE